MDYLLIFSKINSPNKKELVGSTHYVRDCPFYLDVYCPHAMYVREASSKNDRQGHPPCNLSRPTAKGGGRKGMRYIMEVVAMHRQPYFSCSTYEREVTQRHTFSITPLFL